jgi:hypothetical protein
VDNDIKDALLASTFNAWLYDRFGRAPFRHRGNSHSRLMLFRGNYSTALKHGGAG